MWWEISRGITRCCGWCRAHPEWPTGRGGISRAMAARGFPVPILAILLAVALLAPAEAGAVDDPAALAAQAVAQAQAQVADVGAEIAAATGGALAPTEGAPAPAGGPVSDPAPAPAPAAPSNTNVAVDVLSPGDSAPVAQSNTGAPGGSNTNIAVHVLSPGSAAPVSQANSGGSAAPPEHPPGESAPTTEPAAAAPTEPAAAAPMTASAAPSPGPPAKWNWNWKWTGGCAGAAPRKAPSAPRPAATGWNWSWDWSGSCGVPAPPDAGEIVEAVTQAIDALPVPVSAAADGAVPPSVAPSRAPAVARRYARRRAHAVRTPRVPVRAPAVTAHLAAAPWTASPRRARARRASRPAAQPSRPHASAVTRVLRDPLAPGGSGARIAGAGAGSSSLPTFLTFLAILASALLLGSGAPAERLVDAWARRPRSGPRRRDRPG